MDSSNLYFFSGENVYMLDHELMRWKQNFRDKHGPENLLILRGKDVTLSDLLDAVSTMPFIAERRLVIVEGLPKIEKEDFVLLVENIHPQTVLVIAEPKPDKRLGLLKEIIKHCEEKKFPVLSPQALASWIQTLVRSLGSSIHSSVMTELISIVGTDQWTLEKELQKLAAFAGAEIRREHVEALAVPSGEQVIWKLTDLIGSRKPEEAISFFCHRLERGEDVYGMWSILLNCIKNLALVSAALNAGVRDGNITGLHPFVVRGLTPLARSLRSADVRNLVDWATEADIQLKSGGYRFTAEHQGEVVSLVERGILMTKG